MSTTILAAAQEFATRLKLTGSGPQAITGQPLEYRVAISALLKAHREIVNSHIDWQFLWAQGTAHVGPGANPNTPNQADVRQYDEATFYCNGIRLQVVPWADYRKRKLTTDEQNATDAPQYAVILPDNQLLVLPYPDQAYTVTFDYWRYVADLTENAHLIQIPDDGIEALYDRAKMIWLGDEEAPNYALAQVDFEVSYDALEDSYWPGKARSSMAADQEIVVVPE